LTKSQCSIDFGTVQALPSSFLTVRASSLCPLRLFATCWASEAPNGPRASGLQRASGRRIFRKNYWAAPCTNGLRTIAKCRHVEREVVLKSPGGESTMLSELGALPHLVPLHAAVPADQQQGPLQHHGPRHPPPSIVFRRLPSALRYADTAVAGEFLVLLPSCPVSG
jgi:hypothetical protein